MLTWMATAVLNMSLTATLVMIPVLLVRLLLRKAPRIYSYLLWAVVLFRLLCPVALTASVSLLPEPVAQTGNVVTTVEFVEYITVSGTPENRETPGLPDQPSTQVKPEEDWKTTAMKALPMAWACGVAVMLAVSVVQLVLLKRRLLGAVHLRGNLYLADQIDTAFVMGLFRPRIYLPSVLTLRERKCIIAHEKHHIRRGDYLVKLLAYGALCLHWFNPMVWLAFFLSGRDMEMSCDEAVVKKLGPQVRADYAATLLRLAVGRPVLGGTPLAFGAGSIKARVMNMARWRRPGPLVRVASLVLCIAILAACGVNPAREEAPPAPQPEASVPTEAVPGNLIQEEPGQTNGELLTKSGSFQSVDGTVQYSWDLNAPVSTEAMGEMAAAPYLLTGEDAKRVAEILFENAEFREGAPVLAEIHTREEIRRKLQLWRLFTERARLEDLMGIDPVQADQVWQDTVDGDIALVEKFIQEYTARLETAPEKSPYGPCQWTFKEDAWYTYSPEEIASGAVDRGQQNYNIEAQTWVDDIPYRLVFTRDNSDGYARGYISVYLYAGISPATLEESYYVARLCRTPKPTEEQAAQMKARAEQMLLDMNLGQWYVDQCQVVTTEGGTDSQDHHDIRVRAMPVVNGIPVLRSGNNTLEEAQFVFNAEGKLLSFHMGVGDTVKEIQPAETMMPLETLSAMAQAELETWSRTRLIADWYLPMFEAAAGESLGVRADITEAKTGLLRVEGSPAGQASRYIPVILFSGNAEAVGLTSGEVMEGVMDAGGGSGQLRLCLDARDGTVIDLQ